MPPLDAPYVRTFVLDADVVQGAGVVQGGIVAGVLGEAVVDFATRVVGPNGAVELETLDVCFERAARPGSCTVHGVLLRAGRSLQVWDARLVGDDGKTVASARATHRVRTTR